MSLILPIMDCQFFSVHVSLPNTASMHTDVFRSFDSDSLQVRSLESNMTPKTFPLTWFSNTLSLFGQFGASSTFKCSHRFLYSHENYSLKPWCSGEIDGTSSTCLMMRCDGMPASNTANIFRVSPKMS
jgi:hypothetical protein